MTTFSDRYGAWLKRRGYEITDETDRMVELRYPDGATHLIDKTSVVLTWLDADDA